MNTHVKTLLTLAVLAVLVLLGVDLGMVGADDALPAHGAADRSATRPTVQPGDRVAAPKVTVSVYNASDRVGLAERTMAAFEDQGFGPGNVGNAPKGTDVNYAQIWTEDRQQPRRPAGGQPARTAARTSSSKEPKGPGRDRAGRAAVRRSWSQGKQSIKVTEADHDLLAADLSRADARRPLTARRASGRDGRARRRCAGAGPSARADRAG